MQKVSPPWPLAALPDLCNIFIGRTPDRGNSRYWGTGHYWLSIADMNQGKFIARTKETITNEAVRECNCRVVEPGTLMMSFKLSIGKLSFAKVPMFTNEAIAALPIRNPKRLDSEYLYYALLATDLEEGTDRAVKGVTLNLEKFNNIFLPLPPLDEQQRIAAILQKADRVRRLRRYARALSESVLQGVFLEMFGDPVTNPKKLPWVEIQDICETRLGKMLDAKKQTGKNKRLYLRNENVQWMRIDISDLYEMDFDEKDREILRLKTGDVLICEGGEVGRCAIWKGQLDECYYQKALHRARLFPDKAVPDYFVWLMWCLAKLGGLGDFTSQVTIAHLTGEKLREVKFPLPPLQIQNEFASIVRKYDLINKQQAESERQAEHLFQSLLKRAFAGQL